MIRPGIEPIEIELDKTRHLLLTVGGLKLAERELNKSRNLQPHKAIFKIIMEELAEIDQGNCSMDFQEAMLWAAMIHEDRELRLDEVGFMPWGLRDLTGLVVELITQTYLKIPASNVPESEEEKKIS